MHQRKHRAGKQKNISPEAKIKTYDTGSFRDRFMQQEQALSDILKTDFGKFFIVRVEDMLRLIKLPVPPARSTAHTLIYLTSGEANMTIGSESHTIYANECLIVPATQVFSFRHRDINNGYLCHFRDDSVLGKFSKNALLRDFEFLQPWSAPRITLDPETSQHVEHLFKRLLNEYSRNGLAHMDIIQSNFIAVLCEINQARVNVSAGKPSQAGHLTNRFRALLFTHSKSHHRVGDYADLLNISANHLNKSVKAVTGKSPTKWIDEALVLEAKVLLYQSNLSVSEIAAEVGLYDPSYFSRLFKKQEGVTPLQFRKRIEKS
jgi:AraC family transcriptional activator of pobA